jgi:hypothetical protein
MDALLAHDREPVATPLVPRPDRPRLVLSAPALPVRTVGIGSAVGAAPNEQIR